MRVSKRFFFYSILTVLTLLIYQAQCGIEYQQVKNAENVLQFTVIMDKWINFPNVHRKSSSPVRLSLTGGEINEIVAKSSNLWTLILADNTTLDISVVNWGNTTETHFVWKGDKSKEVCFNYGVEKHGVYWYSTNESMDQKWPMDTSKRMTKTNFNHLSEYFFVYDASEFYYVLEHLFLNSDGFAVMRNQEKSWFIRRDPQQGEPILCFSTDNSYPYSNTIGLKSNEIDFHILTSNNIRTVTDFVYSSDYIPKPPKIPDERNFIYPTVFEQFTKDEEIMNDVNRLTSNGFTNMELFLNLWENNRGDLAFRNSISDNTISKLTQQSFRIRLEVMNLVNNIHESTRKYMLKDNVRKPTNLIDFTIPEACKWYESLLSKFYFEQEIGQFHLFFEHFSNMSMLNNNNLNRNVYFTNWLETVTKVGNMTSYVGYKTQKLPYFVVAIKHTTNLSQMLQMIIPNALSISTAGYSFFCNYVIGISEKIQEEMYIRLVQAASLMPCMMFGYLPLDHSKSTIDLTKKFINLHKEHSAIIIELAKKRVSIGSPIIRPMWYAEPNESNSFPIDDQFMLGEDIVVAPVVKVGQRERSVYLPTGNWIDNHGKTYRGPGTFVVNAPLEDLPYFKRNVL